MLVLNAMAQLEYNYSSRFLWTSEIVVYIHIVMSYPQLLGTGWTNEPSIGVAAHLAHLHLSDTFHSPTGITRCFTQESMTTVINVYVFMPIRFIIGIGTASLFSISTNLSIILIKMSNQTTDIHHKFNRI